VVTVCKQPDCRLWIVDAIEQGIELAAARKWRDSLLHAGSDIT
jgi:hypothetical protein